MYSETGPYVAFLRKMLSGRVVDFRSGIDFIERIEPLLDGAECKGHLEARIKGETNGSGGLRIKIEIDCLPVRDDIMASIPEWGGTAIHVRKNGEVIYTATLIKDGISNAKAVIENIEPGEYQFLMDSDKQLMD